MLRDEQKKKFAASGIEFSVISCPRLDLNQGIFAFGLSCTSATRYHCATRAERRLSGFSNVELSKYVVVSSPGSFGPCRN